MSSQTIISCASDEVSYKHFELRNEVVKLFRLYDQNDNAELDKSEFTKMINNLLVMKTYNMLDGKKVIDTKFLSQTVESILSSMQSLKLTCFVNTVLANPSPFNNIFPNAETGLQVT